MATKTTARAKAADEKLEAAHEMLVKKTAELTTSAGWLDYLRFAARFRQYSLNNTLLILIQCPEATHVASYKKWGEMDRQVRKGEKGLSIFAPMMRKITDEKTGDEKRVLAGFRIVSTFDISQTDGAPVPEPIRPALLDGEAPEGLWNALAAMVLENGYTLERGDCGGANGYTRPDTKTIRVREDVSNLQAVKTLVHEIAHMLLHTEGNDLTTEALRHRGVAEVEAESTAFIVLGALGIETDDYTLPYIGGWSDGKPEVVAATADRVLKTAKQILAKSEPAEVEPAA